MASDVQVYALCNFEKGLSHAEAHPNDPKAIDHARESLKILLEVTLGVPQTRNIPFSKLLQTSQSDHSAKRNVALFCYRALAVDKIFSDDKESRSLYHYLVQLIEDATPDLLPEKKSDFENRQTYQKISLLQQFLAELFRRLDTLRNIPPTINDIVSQKQAILSVINRKQAKAFFSPYGFTQASAQITSLLTDCETVCSCSDDELGRLVEEIISKITLYMREDKDFYSYINSRFVEPFYETVKTALQHLLDSSRARFDCSIKVILFHNRVEKKYPIAESEREFILSLSMENTGPGTAFDVRVELSESDQLYLHNREMYLGDLRPGKFSVSLECLTIAPANEATLSVYVSWRRACDPALQEALSEIRIAAQQPDIDWANCAMLRPYNTEVAEGKHFVGRHEKVLSIANRFLRTPMISCYISGQKRVGKTSLALAARDYIIERNDKTVFEFRYYLWGHFSHEDARESLRYLGEDLAEFFKSFMPSTHEIPHMDFSGSLAPLRRLLDIVAIYEPRRSFVIIIDEFDEIHPELYAYGNLAETFFSNIRALSAGKSLAFMFVGGENMQFIMAQQGQKLNKFEGENLDYFSRHKEWDDFCSLVRQPTINTIFWHESALNEIYNITNGNPLFTKVGCSWVFSLAVDQRDTDVTSDEVRRALDEKIGQMDINVFAHLWQDGIGKIKSEAKPVELQRCRSLVAIARVMRKGLPLHRDHIKSEKHSSDISENELQGILDDFCRRDVLREERGEYQFVLPIFSRWLSDVGMNKIISDKLGEELRAIIQEEEDRAYVTATELAQLSERWPLYQGRKVSPEDIRAWLDQVESHRERRLLFKLLGAIRFFSEQEIRDKLRSMHGFVRQIIAPLQRVPLTRSQRVFELAVVYIDGQGKSGHYYASRYAEENGVSTKCIFSSRQFKDQIHEFENKENRKIKEIIIVDDFVGTGEQIRADMGKFIDDNIWIQERCLPILLVVIAATKEGFESVQEHIGNLTYPEISFRACEILDDQHVAFSESNIVWENQDERNKAKSICLNIGVHIYRDNPLGFGAKGLLVVFPNTVPNNSLPVLHSPSSDAKKWRPLFPRLVN